VTCTIKGNIPDLPQLPLWSEIAVSAGTKDSNTSEALEVTYKPGDWPSALPMPDASSPISKIRPSFQYSREQRTKNGIFFRGFSASALL
jgi:hypothetical protein